MRTLTVCAAALLAAACYLPGRKHSAADALAPGLETSLQEWLDREDLERREVLMRFGPPELRRQGDRLLVYLREGTSGTLLVPVPAPTVAGIGGIGFESHHRLLLVFDAAGAVDSWHYEKRSRAPELDELEAWIAQRLLATSG